MNGSSASAGKVGWLGACLLASAAFVTLVRALHVADPDYDLTIQIQAARHLLAGRGLTVYLDDLDSNDLARALIPRTLTHFPCGYSLYAAALLAAGARLGTVVKLYGALSTLAGWWGWGRLATVYVGGGLAESGAMWRAGAAILAAIGPLLSTPGWQGTDIFLWASAPWVILWITPAPDGRAAGATRDALAGTLCGLCVLMRYASLFMVAAALLLIAGQGLRHPRRLLARAAGFAAGLAPVLAVQWYVSRSSGGLGAPGGLGSIPAWAEVWTRGLAAARNLDAVNAALFFWLPERALDRLAGPVDQVPWQLAVAALALVLPYLAARRCGARSLAAACSDARVAAVVLIPVLPLVLWACMLVGPFNYLTERRYYWPVIPPVVLVAGLLALGAARAGVPLGRGVRGASRVYLAAVVVAGLVGTTSLFLPGASGVAARVAFAGTGWTGTWPSGDVYYDAIPSRKYVAAYVAEHPETLLFTSFESWFYADDRLDPSRIFRLLFFDTWRRSIVKGYARLLFMVSDHGEAPTEFGLNLRFAGDEPRTASLEHLPNVRVLARFPAEGVKVLEAEIPAGVRVRLDPGPAAGEGSTPASQDRR